MKIESLKRANEIQIRLQEIARARELWETETSHLRGSMLVMLLGISRHRNDEPVPAPIAKFQRACLDQLATEEAVLLQEFDAL